MKKSLNVIWQYEKDDNTFTFIVPYKSSYASAYEALQAIVNDMQEGEKQAMEHQKQQQESKKDDAVA